MAPRTTDSGHRRSGHVCRPAFGRDLQARRVISVELPEFLIYALEQRVREANVDAPSEEIATLNHYIESELADLITVRDIAELEMTAPGFGAAVQRWLDEIGI